jgi:pimeloyl-ACP methyl ester carboxylesterase
MGSTQLAGCRGDFCGYTFDVDEALEVDSRGGKWGGGRGGGGGSKLKNKGRKAGGGGEDAEAEVRPEDYQSVPFKCIAQARAETTLVSLLLRRHENREDGDYVTQQYLSKGGVLAEHFPGRYYQPAKVCPNCHKVYNMVEAAREKALHKLDREADRTRGVARPTSKGSSLAAAARPYSSGGGTDGLLPPDDPKEAALVAAQEAVSSLSKSDVAELRTFTSPPPAVTMVTSALMIILTGEQLPWAAAKRVMANGDRFLSMLAEFHPDSLTEPQLRQLRAFVRNAAFHPTHVEPVSRCAAKFCGWVLGMLQAHAWRAASDDDGGGGGYDATAYGGTAAGGNMMMSATRGSASSGTARLDPLRAALDATRPLTAPGETQSMDTIGGPGGLTMSASSSLPPVQDFGATDTAGSSFANKLERRREQQQAQAQQQQTQQVQATQAATTTTDRQRVKAEAKEVKRRRRAEVEARKTVQKMQMSRLAKTSGLEDIQGGEGGGGGAPSVGSCHVFTCADGVTKIPYLVLGKPDYQVRKVNFVVLHDFFDTFEATQIFFKRVVSDHLGCQVLVLNYPGQAGTSIPLEPTEEDLAEGADQAPALNNEWLSMCVHELLQSLNSTGELQTGSFPFYLMGVGNGANVATALALRHGKEPAYRDTMRGLVMLNAFARVDSQLAAVLHSSINVFSCFPPTRPDLPVSYFTRFLFSDEYLSKVDKNLALNLYTAVNNPISLDGRIRICKGALMHSDLRRQLDDLDVPLIMVQSTENVLVNPTNVDPYLEGRAVSHLWSHQLAGGSLGRKGQGMLRSSLNGRNNAFVVWLRTGHELRQEAKRTILDLIDQLADPSSELEPPTPAVSMLSSDDEHQQQQRQQAGKVRRRKRKVKRKGKGKSRTKKAAGGIVTAGGEQGDREEEEEEEEEEGQEVPATEEEEEEQSSYSAPPPALGESATAAPSAPDVGARPDLPEAVISTATSSDSSSSSSNSSSNSSTDTAAATAAGAGMSVVRAAAAAGGGGGAEERADEESDRLARLQQAEDEFELELKSHKQRKRQIEEEQRRAAAAESAGATAGAADLEHEQTHLEAKIRDLKEKAAERKRQLQEEGLARIEKLKQEQDSRRDEWESEDAARLRELEEQLQGYASQRAADAGARDAALSAAEAEIAAGAEAEYARFEETFEGVVQPPPDRVRRPSIGTLIPKQMQLSNMFEQMEAEEAEMKRLGILKLEEYERVKRDMEAAHVERKRAMAAMAEAELRELQHNMAIRIQAGYRGMMGRRRAEARRIQLEQEEREYAASCRINNMIRGWLARQRVKKMKEKEARDRELAEASLSIQRVFRGHMARVRVDNIRRLLGALLIQRVYRGYLGRLRALREKERLEELRRQEAAATKIQATWRMKMGRDEYRRRRIFELAATEVQRVWRGYLGRRRATRMRAWETAEPGAERLALGLQMIEESKLAFERQQEEIDALHRAQEQAETRSVCAFGVCVCVRRGGDGGACL